jgi:hypothetical protein
MNPGFAGIDNELYYMNKTLMLFGDAKGFVAEIVKELPAKVGAYPAAPGLRRWFPNGLSDAEFLARVRTLLRRGPNRQPDTLRVCDLEIDFVQHRAVRRGKRLDPTPKEFSLLSLLAREWQSC